MAHRKIKERAAKRKQDEKVVPSVTGTTDIIRKKG